jgi:hypothetical protein
MDFHYEIFPAERAIVLRWHGRVTLADMHENLHRLWSDPRYSRTFDGLIDLTAVEVGMAMKDVRALVDYVHENAQTSMGRWAAIAVSPLTTACAYLYRHASRHPFDVFSTRESACRFVGFDLDARDGFDSAKPPRRREGEGE